MKDKTTKFIRKKEIALSALISEPTIRSAAKVAGIGETTLWRWLKEKDFADAYRELKREAVDQAIARLQVASGKAVDTLVEVIENVENPPSVRVNAAKTIIEMAVKAVEYDEIERRIEDLEVLVYEQKKA